MQSSLKYIKFSLVFLPIHFISFYAPVHLPLALVYGPLIYAVAYGISIKSFIYHLIFPIIFFLYSILYNYGILDWNNWFSLSFSSCYYLLTAISLNGYYVALYLKNHNLKIKNSVIKKDLLHFLKFIFTVVSIFTIVLFLKSIGLIDNLGFNPLYLINLLIGLTFFIALFYLVQMRKQQISTEENLLNDGEDSKIMKEYETTFTVFFQESKLFLQPDISLELISEKMDVPKHHLSKLFNSHMGKNFYVLVSEYRINYAKEILKEDSNITIESLAYECGFNSKSTFNKYFKEHTGYSPSEYRSSFFSFS